MPPEVRLQKFIADAGVCSRREAEARIEQGRVRVNGEAVDQQGVKVDPDKDRVEVDGVVVRAPEAQRTVVALHKPHGCLVTRKDPQGRRTVFELLPTHLGRLIAVGRLDYATEGLLLFTSDGQLADALMHPSSGVVRDYEVKVKGHPTRRAVQKVARGIEPEGERPMVPLEVAYLRRTKKNCWYRITLTEGRYHEVRRLFEAADLEVLRLVRVAYGPVELNTLPLGAWRQLDPGEVQELYEAGEGRLQRKEQARRKRVAPATPSPGPPKPPRTRRRKP